MPRLITRVAPLPPDAVTRSAPVLRTTHPWAWWAWALCAGVTASLTLNPLVLALVAVALVTVVLARRDDGLWARSLKFYLLLGAFIIVGRVMVRLFIGGSTTGTVVFRLPEIHLPAWAAGIRLGGPVTAEELVWAATDATRLATILLCVGAANSLANPRTALKSVPAALHDISVAVVITLTVLPQLIASTHRVRRGRRLRGNAVRGLRGLAATLVPVVEDAVEGSMTLASSMEARGYGRTRGQQKVPGHTTVALLAALVSLLLGAFVVLGVPASPVTVLGLAPERWLALFLLAVGVGLGATGLRSAGRRLSVTRYRPAPWGAPENLVCTCGALAVAVGLWLTSPLGYPDQLNPPPLTLTWPALPLPAILLPLLLALPAVLTPRPQRAGGR
ncbi:CbiQ family ECF transporter T component [Tessaracoccus antarcticus]|uniref:Energy-coupling factor transporter transmembrane protein EcfT n=1 Tax=Tessaracoccus antarcticus TaxID=2479848 RepID=A0A3M0G020_9ACTN|nr:CbiQ family ECF transporter T component [Tessaracoccus antarcticus]RMB58331.1 energy-coupling factor transporter transmembrane protein EcfT [Tessaracoccus antarcticus]